MNKKIGNLTITSFCSDNVEHIKFRKQLSYDDLIYTFVSTNIEDDLQEVSNHNYLEYSVGYIIKDNEELVGYIDIEPVEDRENIIELRYAVTTEYSRLGYLGYHDFDRKGYGEQILTECSNHIFDTFTAIDCVELHIRKDNEASIGCAKKAKYKYYGENNKEYIYRKYKN